MFNLRNRSFVKLLDFTPKEIEFLIDLKWWNRDEDWLRENAELFSNVKEIMSFNTSK